MRMLCVVLLVAVTATASPGRAAPTAPLGCAVPGVDDKCESWLASWDGGHRDMDYGAGASLHPDGRTLYVTGVECRTDPCDVLGGETEIVIRAVDTTTRETRWTARYGPAEDLSAGERSVELSPDGSQLVLAYEDPAPGVHSIQTIAIDAPTGQELWQTRYEGDGTFELKLASLGSVAVARGEPGDDPGRRRERVVVSGDLLWTEVCDISFSCPVQASALAALDPISGALLDQTIERDRREIGPLVASPDGARLYRHLQVLDSGSYELVAYDAATLEVVWRTSFGAEISQFAVVSPDGATVFRGAVGYETLNLRNVIPVAAHDAATGAQRWRTVYRAEPVPGHPLADAFPTRIATNGRQLFLTGDTDQGARTPLLVAFDAGDGRQMWKRTGGDGHTGRTNAGGAWYGLALSPDGETVYTGGTGDQVTAAFDAASGTPRWYARYNSVAEFDTNGERWPTEASFDHLVASSDGRRLYGVGALENPLSVRPPAQCIPQVGCGRRRDLDIGVVAYDLFR